MTDLNYYFPTHKRAFNTAEERLAASQLSPSERQGMIENMVFEYPEFETMVEKIELFHQPVEGGHSAVGFVGGLLGESRSGKTEVIRSFRSNHLPITVDGLGTQYPVAYVQCSDKMSKITLARDIYSATMASSIPSRMPQDSAKHFARTRVKNCGVKLLILDDAQMIFENRRDNTAGIMGVMKELLDSRLCQILLVGTTDVYVGLKDFIHIYRRGGFPVQDMPVYDGSRDAQLKYLGYLKGISKLLPFEQDSDLGRASYFNHFIEQTGGLKGSTSIIVIDAGRKALNERSPCIQPHHLHAACFDRARPGQTFIPFTGVSE